MFQRNPNVCQYWQGLLQNHQNIIFLGCVNLTSRNPRLKCLVGALHLLCLEHLALDLNVVKTVKTLCGTQQRLQEPSFNDWCNQPPNSIAGITPVNESSS